MNIFDITLDVDKRSNKESVNLRQGDINGTTIRATLRDHDVPMEGGNYTAMFCMTLPDRKTFYHDDATYENGVVSVVVQEQYAAAVPGSTNNAYFELYDGEELKYTTASFMVRVKPSAMDGEAAQSYDLRVETLMDEMRDLIDDETVAEEGRVAAESARVTAEQGRVDTFTANETARSQTFTTNEGLRSTTFTESENARSSQFLDNESDRQAQYEESMGAWTLAETNRASTFAANEAARQSTFEANEAGRTEVFNAFASPTVAVEETATGQVAHITWKDPSGVHVSDMVIDDAINVAMTGDTLSIPVDPSGKCVESGVARFYFSGWVGDRMVPCSATITSAADPRFTVRITNSTAIEHGLIRVEYLEGTTYPTQLDVCTISITCSGRTFLHRISAVAPRGGVAIDGADGRDGADGLSPTVSIASTPSEHTVTITDVSGEHSYEVPTYASEEAARASAESDRAAAESARATAESSRVTAELARESAETQRDATVTAISDKIDALTARGPSNETSFLYRVTNDGNRISGKAAVITSIHGNTLRWNQHVKTGTNNWTVSGGAKSYADDVITVTPNGGEGFTYCAATQIMDISSTPNNKYFVSLDFLKEDWSDTAASSNYAFPALFGLWLSAVPSLVPNKSVTTWQHLSGIVSLGSENPSKAFSFRCYSDTYPFSIKNVMVIDLTVMFGAGNEPSTVVEFEALYPLPYYEYDAGSLLPVCMTGVETTGFNQWDEEWELGTIRSTTGVNAADGNKVRAKNYIRVIPNQTYYMKMPNVASVYMYDAGKNFVRQGPSWSINSNYVIPEGIHFIRFTFGSSVNPVIKIDKGTVCINLPDPTRNGEYEPYRKAERLIAAGTLRSAGTVYDELTETERITRVGVVDLGSLTWVMVTSSEAPYFSAIMSDIVHSNQQNNFSCARYDKAPIGSSGTTIGICTTDAPSVRIRDTTYSTAVEFKTAMSGVMLYYALATPTTVEIDSPLNLTYHTEQGGTERVMVPTGEQSAPPVMQLSYDVSVIDGLITMPEDYISHASFAAFCAALEQAANLTIIETWSETAQAYSYEIVSGA